MLHMLTSFTDYFALFHQGHFIFVSKNLFLVFLQCIIKMFWKKYHELTFRECKSLQCSSIKYSQKSAETQIQIFVLYLFTLIKTDSAYERE